LRASPTRDGGTGDLDGLAREEIPLAARIGVADAFDAAMLSLSADAARSLGRSNSQTP
jgi:HD-GYP domain-containing protein (c-di-GMP phosphodiesterase class II)